MTCLSKFQRQCKYLYERYELIMQLPHVLISLARMFEYLHNVLQFWVWVKYIFCNSSFIIVPIFFSTITHYFLLYAFMVSVNKIGERTRTTWGRHQFNQRYFLQFIIYHHIYFRARSETIAHYFSIYIFPITTFVVPLNIKLKNVKKGARKKHILLFFLRKFY